VEDEKIPASAYNVFYQKNPYLFLYPCLHNKEAQSNRHYRKM